MKNNNAKFQVQDSVQIIYYKNKNNKYIKRQI